MNDVNFNGLQPETVRATSVSGKAATANGHKSGNSLPSSAGGGSGSDTQGSVSNVETAVAKLNEYTQSTQRSLLFDVDEASGRTVVTVLDRQTEEVIRQIPDDVFLEMARNLKESLESGSGDALHLISAQA